jgi:hypothetical protein
MKNASILMKLGTNVDWTIASGNGGMSQNCEKITSLHCLFSINTDFKVLDFSMN